MFLETPEGILGNTLMQKEQKAMEINDADVAELVDARDLKSLDGNVVRVRVPPPAPRFASRLRGGAVSRTRVRYSLSLSESEDGPSLATRGD